MIRGPNGPSDNSHYRVTPGRDDGWEVVVERAGAVSSTYCSDWHRVERVCASLDQQMRASRVASARIDLDPGAAL